MEVDTAHLPSAAEHRSFDGAEDNSWAAVNGIHPIIPDGITMDAPSPAPSLANVKEEDDALGKGVALKRSGSNSGRSTPQPANGSAPNKRSNKRKAGGAAALANANPDSFTPPPPIIYNDSSVLAAPPLLVPTNYSCPITNKRFFTTKTHPTNKMGFRYYPCGPSPDSTLELPLHRVIESPPADCVRFSWEDRSPYIYMTEDALTLTTDKGFRAARANVPLRQGTWYFEVVCDRAGGIADPAASTTGSAPGQSGIAGSSSDPHVRLGIGRRESGLNAPVGFDGYSYGIRDKTGEKVTLSQPKVYGQPFATGDVIGVLLHLPTRRLRSQVPTLANGASNPAYIVRKRVAIRSRAQLYFESHEFAMSKEMTDMADAISDAHTPKVKNARQKAAAPGTKYRPLPSELQNAARPLPTLHGSALWFFKNGELMDSAPAFQNLYDWLPLEELPKPANAKPLTKTQQEEKDKECINDDGTLGYYPFVSCYGGGIATLNAGPDWKFPPTTSPNKTVGSPSTWRPLSSRQAEYMAETTALDEREEAEARTLFEKKRAALAAADFGRPKEAKIMKRSNSALAPSPLSTAVPQEKAIAQIAAEAIDTEASQAVKMEIE